MNPRLSSTLRAAIPLAVFLSIVAALAYAVVPLTYDEAYNWRQFASRGWRVACCDYEAPNNHVFFSIVSGALNSQAMIDTWPFNASPWMQRAGGAALGANLLFGLSLFATTAFRPGGFTRDRTFMELTPAPFTAKHWNRVTRNATAIDCRGYSEWPCNLFNGTFAAHHISRENIANASGRCLIGSAPYPGDSGSDMFVRMKYGDAGRLCFP